MRIDILTLFPKMFDGFLSESIIKRAISKGIVNINIVDFRNYSLSNNNQVDDTPFGGGAGMVLMCQPIVDAILDLKNEDTTVILMCPTGKTYNQEMAFELRELKHIILVCGHYEGFDERIREFVDMEISIGDFILTGGEIPAMAISDSIIRLLDGTILKDSYLNESFSDSLLDYPVYTKPRDFRGLKVPDVLVSGDHKKINEYRKNMQKKITKEKRPDLLKGE